MIEFNGKGIVQSVSEVIQIKNFQKRELVISDSWQGKDGVSHESHILIEFTGEKMQELNSLIPGDTVAVKGYIMGKDYKGRIYNTVRGMSVVSDRPQQNCMPSSAPSQPYQQPAYPQQIFGGYGYGR